MSSQSVIMKLRLMYSADATPNIKTSSWTEFFDSLKEADTPESDIFFWADDLTKEGHTDDAKELVREYLAYRRKHGRVGEMGIVGSSEEIAKKLGFDYSRQE